MIQRLHGTVRGKTIEIDGDLGLHDGDKVELSVRVVPPAERSEPWGEGLKRCAGALADSWTPEDDAILQEIYQARKRDSRRIDDL